MHPLRGSTRLCDLAEADVQSLTSWSLGCGPYGDAAKRASEVAAEQAQLQWRRFVMCVFYPLIGLI